MKKSLALLLALLIVAASLSACGKNGADKSGEEPQLIAVALTGDLAGDERITNYLSNELGPKLNLVFDFSENLADTESTISFVENEISKGAVGLISSRPEREAIASLCNDAGIFLVNINSQISETEAALPFVCGTIGSSVQGTADAYALALGDVLDDGEDHSVIIYSGASSFGAITHIITAEAVLRAFQDKYDLTYDQDISELARTRDVGKINTGKDNIKIFIVPGTNIPEVGQVISTQLQTGDYDIVVAVMAYTAFTNYIDEVERALNKDIKFLPIASFSDDTERGFTTKDSFGNSVLDACIMNSQPEVFGLAAGMLRLGLDGKADQIKKDGMAQLFMLSPWVCPDEETYEKLNTLNSGPGTYYVSGDEMVELLKTVDADGLTALLAEMSDVNNVLNKLFK